MSYPNVKVVGSTAVVRVDIVPSGPAYTAGDVIGTAGGATVLGGKLPIPGALRSVIQTGVLQSLTLYDGYNQKPALTVLVFNGKPVEDCTDNAAPGGLTYSDGTDNVLGVISIAAADWVTVNGSGGNTAVVTKANLGLPVRISEDVVTHPEQCLYFVVISGGTPDWVGQADELVAVFGFLQD